MKVLFISRATLYTDKGGDTIQISNTAAHLINLGVQVQIKLSNEQIDYDGFDLVHFFNIIRPADILSHIRKIKVPFVVSTIFVDYSEYEKKQRMGFAGLIFKLLPSDLIEYAKVIARSISSGEKIGSNSYLFLGQKRSIKKILRKASMLLPNSNNEYQRLFNQYGIEKRYRVIPNAIDRHVFTDTVEAALKDMNLVLCVGRIEGRKNQLNLIKALNNSRFTLFIIGTHGANQAGYFKLCKNTASANVHFINNLPQEQLIAYYTSAKVHVLPSWFETTGLSSLEAAAMGCNVVITGKGDTREYFEDMAYYCDPASPESIRSAVEAASDQPFNEKLRQKILIQYTWQNTAKETLEAYHEVLQLQGLCE